MRQIEEYRSYDEPSVKVYSGGTARPNTASLQIRVVTHTELQFPAFVFGFMDAPEFKNAEFGDVGMERDWHVVILRLSVNCIDGGQGGFERIGFAEFIR